MPLPIPILRLDFSNKIYRLNGQHIAQPMIVDNSGFPGSGGIVIDDVGLMVNYTDSPFADPVRRFSKCNDEDIILALQDGWNSGAFIWIQRTFYDYFGTVIENDTQWDGVNALKICIPGDGFFGQGAMQISEADMLHPELLNHYNVITGSPNPPDPTYTALISGGVTVPATGETHQSVWMIKGGNLYMSYNGSATESIAMVPVVAGGYDPDITSINFQGFIQTNETQKHIVFAGAWDATNVDPAIDLPIFSDPGFDPFDRGLGQRAQHILGWIGS